MLNNVKNLRGFTVAASDGDAGNIQDVYFDDEKWIIRHLVVETGGWFSGRKVLISPFSVLGVDWPDERMRLNLTKEQIRNGPDIDIDKPVSRQHEAAVHDHYGYPYYWAGPYVWGYSAYPTLLAERAAEYAHEDAVGENIRKEREQGDPHLRSGREVVGYEIQATDDTVGHVEDFLFDDRDWSIRLMIVETRNWWPGRDVLISPKRIDRISWENRQIIVNITREEVEGSQEYDPAYPPPIGPKNEIYHRFGMPPHRIE